MNWVPVSFPLLLVPCIFLFISLCIVFSPSFILHPYSLISVISVLNSACDRLAICCLVLYLEFWSVLSFGPYFFVSVYLLCYKEWSLRYWVAWGNPLHCIVAVYSGEVSEREWWSLVGSPHFQSLPPLCTNKENMTFWCSFPGGWACVLLGTHFSPPTKSPVRLAVSPASASPHRYWQPEFLKLSVASWNPRLRSLCGSPVGPPGVCALECGTALPLATTSPTLSACCRLTTSPFSPGCPSLPLLPVQINAASLTHWLLASTQFNFLAVLLVFCFCVGCYPSFACVRKQSCLPTPLSLLEAPPQSSILTIYNCTVHSC